MPLLDVIKNFVESGTKGLVSVWDVAEIAFDPLSFGRNVEGKCFRTVVSDL